MSRIEEVESARNRITDSKNYPDHGGVDYGYQTYMARSYLEYAALERDK